MRFHFAPVLAIVILAPAVAAHVQTGTAQTHLSVRSVELSPGENHTFAIETGEGPWLEGMVFILYLQFLNESRQVLVELLFGDFDVIANWTFTDDERHKVSTLIPFDEGPYSLRVSNLAETETRLFYYFDQNCNCTFKPVPLDEGWVIFHYDVPQDRVVTVGFPLIANWTVEGVLAARTGTGAAYPDDFRIIETQTMSGTAWLNFTLAEAGTRHYLFLTALAGSPTFPNPNVFVQLTPLVEQRAVDTPGPLSPAVLIAVALALLWARRR